MLRIVDLTKPNIYIGCVKASAFQKSAASRIVSKAWDGLGDRLTHPTKAGLIEGSFLSTART